MRTTPRRPLVRQGYGLANRKGGTANTPEDFSLHACSSVGKMFTAVTIAKLVESEAMYRSTALLRSLLPVTHLQKPREESGDSRVITDHELGNPEYCSGALVLGTGCEAKSSVNLWRLFAKSPLQFRPGTQWSYSNSNFLLFRTIIERQTGRPFILQLKPRSFARSVWLIRDMRFAAFPSRRSVIRTPPAGARADYDARWYPACEEPKPGDDCLVCTPIGGRYSTADDLARFADALMSNRILSRELTARVLTGHVDADYGGRDGYGFETRLVNGVKMAGHRGSFPGSSNQVEFYPDSATSSRWATPTAAA